LEKEGMALGPMSYIVVALNTSKGTNFECLGNTDCMLSNS